MRVLSPVTGIVCARGRQHPPESSAFIRIFISPLADHTVRSPISARVLAVSSRRGLRMPAFLPHAIKCNSQTTILLGGSERRQLSVRIVVGLLTKRIEAFARARDIIDALSPLAYIYLGSLVEVSGEIRFLPHLRCWHRVSAGDVIGEW